MAIKQNPRAEPAARKRDETHRERGAQGNFADGLRCFREEAKALIDFQRHPSTVASSEFFRASGTAYLVMEYVDGQPLSQVLREREAAVNCPRDPTCPVSRSLGGELALGPRNRRIAKESWRPAGIRDSGQQLIAPNASQRCTSNGVTMRQSVTSAGETSAN